MRRIRSSGNQMRDVSRGIAAEGGAIGEADLSDNAIDCREAGVVVGAAAPAGASAVSSAGAPQDAPEVAAGRGARRQPRAGPVEPAVLRTVTMATARAGLAGQDDVVVGLARRIDRLLRLAAAGDRCGRLSMGRATCVHPFISQARASLAWNP